MSSWIGWNTHCGAVYLVRRRENLTGATDARSPHSVIVLNVIWGFILTFNLTSSHILEVLVRALRLNGGGAINSRCTNIKKRPISILT